MEKAWGRILSSFLVLVLLAACATPPPLPKEIPLRPVRESISRFLMDARASIKQGQKVQTLRLSWQHTAQDDSIGFASSLGTTLAELQRDSLGARWLAADGEKYEARSADMLMARMTSEPVPIETLALWVLGRTSPAAQNIQTDTEGRLLQAEDNGWFVSIDAYENDKPNALPLLVTFSRGILQIRLAVEDWGL